jgi:hypothetical protein
METPSILKAAFIMERSTALIQGAFTYRFDKTASLRIEPSSRPRATKPNAPHEPEASATASIFPLKTSSLKTLKKDGAGPVPNYHYVSDGNPLPP